MASSLSSLINNLSERVDRVKCKIGHDDKNVKLVELNISIVSDCFLEYINFKDDLIEYKCLCCNKKYIQIFLPLTY